MLAAAFSTAVPLWLWITWSLLGLVSLGLLLLLLSPWGRSQPLRKCVLISLMVHALLLTYAATVKILSGYQGPPRETTPIRIVDISTEPEQQPPAEEAQQPWERLEAEPPELPHAQPQRETVPELSSSRPARRQATGEDSAAVLPPMTDPREEDQPPEPSPPEELPRVEPPPERAVPVPARATRAPRPQTPRSSPKLPKLQTPEDRPPSGPQRPIVGEPRPVEAAVVQQRPGPLLPEMKTDLDAELLRGQEAERELPPLPRLESSRLPAPVQATAQQTPPASAPEPVRRLLPSRHRAAAAVPQAVPSPPEPEEPLITQPLVPVRVKRPQPEPPPQRTAPPAPALALRNHARRLQRVLEQGGNEQTEQAIQRALTWLAAQQQQDGSWSATAHGGGRDLRTLGQARPKAGTRAETGVTGLVLLAFLGSGHTHVRGPYKQTVARGLDYLLAQQDRSTGALSGRATLYAAMYCHAMATLALAESYLMTGDPRLKEPLRRAVRYTLHAQHPHTGGWRYRPGDALGDTSQLGWQLMVLHCGRMARVHDSAVARQRAEWFLRSVSSGRHGGLAAYQVGHRPSPTMTAEALFCRVLLGAPADDPALREAAAYLMDHLPRETEPNFYYWYYGTLALYHLQDEHWRRWNQALVRTLLALQEKQGPQRGSWTARSAWGSYGGRAFTTALAVMSLEVYYRYVPAYAQAPGQRAAARKLLRR